MKTKSLVSLLVFTPLVAIAGDAAVSNGAEREDAIVALIVIIASGAFGGFVEGLVNDRPYYLRIAGCKVDIGSLGDTLFGIAAAIAVFAVATALFGIDVTAIWKTDQFLKLVAWGVISGYAGIRLLSPLSEQTVKRIASEQVNASLMAHSSDTVQYDFALADAGHLLDMFDSEKEATLKAGDLPKGTAMLDNAIRRFGVALTFKPSDPNALRGLARAYRRKAEWDQDEKLKAQYWQKAMDALSQIIARDPRAALALYNRACYKNLAGEKVEAVMKDLDEAIQIQDALREFARNDPDFSSIKMTQAFIQAIDKSS